MECDIFLPGERVSLRSINEQDADMLVKWRSDKEIIKYFFNNTPITKEQHMDWYTNHYLEDDNRIDFIVLENAGMRKIGVAGLKNIKGKNVEISYAIGETDMQGKGFAKEALRVLIAYARENLFAQAVDAHINNLNEASVGLIQSLGFEFYKQMEDVQNASVYRLNL